MSPGSRLTLSSQGGDPDTAQVIAEVMRDKSIALTVSLACVSSCAEYLLPAAASLRFKDDAIIGFHQTPAMIESFRPPRGDEIQLPTCDYGDNAAVYQDYSSAPDAWRETLARLQLDRTQLRTTPNCVEVAFRFTHDLWLPTSQQLRDIWQLDFKGDVCADDYNRCRVRLREVFAQSGSVVIGDRVAVLE